jgi:hypothetical protein
MKSEMKDPMTAWIGGELDKVGAAEELEIAPVSDGATGKFVTIWVVRVDDELYVRSVNGRGSAWFRGFETWHEARIRAGGIEKDVIFLEADPKLDDEIEAAYRTKYRLHGAQYVNMMVGPEARSATIKLTPR